MTTARRSEELIRSLDAWHATEETALYKQRSYTFVPEQATSILDVGCGTGDDALALAEHFGGRVEVFGVDCQPELVEEALRRSRNVALRVRFKVADAQSLPFPDESFDVVRADAVLSETSDVSRALQELARVLRIGGVLLVHDRAAALRASDDVAVLGAKTEFALLLPPLHLPALGEPLVLDEWQAKRGLSTADESPQTWLSVRLRKLGRV